MGVVFSKHVTDFSIFLTSQVTSVHECYTLCSTDIECRAAQYVYDPTSPEEAVQCQISREEAKKNKRVTDETGIHSLIVPNKCKRKKGKNQEKQR